MQTKFIKTLLISGISSLSILMFLSGAFLLNEGYNIFDPYADTQMSKDYSPEKFDNIKPGMSRTEIRKIIGLPLISHSDSVKNTFTDQYTNDGLLLHREAGWYPFARDLAWYGSSIEYNRDSIALKIYKDWYYD